MFTLVLHGGKAEGEHTAIPEVVPRPQILLGPRTARFLGKRGDLIAFTPLDIPVAGLGPGRWDAEGDDRAFTGENSRLGGGTDNDSVSVMR